MLKSTVNSTEKQRILAELSGADCIVLTTLNLPLTFEFLTCCINNKSNLGENVHLPN